MARTIAVVRDGLQRSVVRIFQILRAATARSPRQRHRALYTAAIASQHAVEDQPKPKPPVVS
ncbi:MULTISPECIES: hypothetical protein [Streptomyces]|uniref:hypothetical protein n=1 Tax=Streptomyces TaxID=1883 RepID=UPI003570D1B1